MSPIIPEGRLHCEVNGRLITLTEIEMTDLLNDHAHPWWRRHLGDPDKYEVAELRLKVHGTRYLSPTEFLLTMVVRQEILRGGAA